MRNKYYIVNVPSWGKVYYIVNLPGVNLLWGKVYSMTPGLSKMYVAKPLPLSLRNDVVMHSAGFTIMLRCA